MSQNKGQQARAAPQRSCRPPPALRSKAREGEAAQPLRGSYLFIKPHLVDQHAGSLAVLGDLGQR
ncbi:MAG: hypothetical protein ACN6OS_06495, partial [Comamonas testosteroni]